MMGRRPFRFSDKNSASQNSGPIRKYGSENAFSSKLTAFMLLEV
jgi:hypothetical protein